MTELQAAYIVIALLALALIGMTGFLVRQIDRRGASDRRAAAADKRCAHWREESRRYAEQLAQAQCRARVASARIQELRRRCDTYVADLHAITEATRPPAATAALTPDDPALDAAAAAREDRRARDFVADVETYLKSRPTTEEDR
ncbi:hypothetical protein AB0I61_17160 [Polymorphospora rubra]|uniref:hypothetical protein n=1 Tax=Polymorphospora rubra TaxID=338584 RepID=UPI0033C86E88